jgi:hypothetical protein
MQLVDILAIAIATILAIDGLIQKPRLSSATLLEKVVLNYIYSKLQYIQSEWPRAKKSLLSSNDKFSVR